MKESVYGFEHAQIIISIGCEHMKVANICDNYNCEQFLSVQMNKISEWFSTTKVFSIDLKMNHDDRDDSKDEILSKYFFWDIMAVRNWPNKPVYSQLMWAFKHIFECNISETVQPPSDRSMLNYIWSEEKYNFRKKVFSIIFLSFFRCRFCSYLSHDLSLWTCYSVIVI